MKYFYEGLLIVFSVLFALFINKLYEDHKLEKDKKTALLAIESEIQRNQKVLSGWLDSHDLIKTRLQAMVMETGDGMAQKDSLRVLMHQYDFFNLNFLTDKNLVADMPQNTAWETAKNTGITSEFSFGEMELFTNVYGLQQTMVDQTLHRLLNIYFSREAHEPKNFDDTILQFLLCFHELTGQERLMSELYDKALNQMHNKNDD